MNLKKFLGEKYKDGISFEEIQECLAEIPDEFVDQEEYEKMKRLKDDACKDAASWKKKYNSTLSEKEQLEIHQKEDNEELQKKYNELLREQKIDKRKADLMAIGYDAKLAQETAIAMIDGDFEKVIANQSKYAELVKKDTTDKLLKDTQEPEGGGGSEVITRDALRKMSLNERQELYKKDPERFKKIVEGD